MPSVVTRWQGLGAQYPDLARLTNEATVWGALVLESGGQAPARRQEAAEPGGEPGVANTPEQKAA